MKAHINGISIVAPGISTPEDAQHLLSGAGVWEHKPIEIKQPDLLPANERRRTTEVIRLALQALRPLIRDNDDLQSIATVFASAYGDLDISDKICLSLLGEPKQVSPTLFHNSVHNAPSGYWAIAATNTAPSVSLSGGSNTFTAGLLEAMAQVTSENRTVLLVIYDIPKADGILYTTLQEYPVAVALRLGVTAEPGTYGTISVKLVEGVVDAPLCRNVSLNRLLTGCGSVMTGLPLLEGLIRRSRQTVSLQYGLTQHLQIKVSHG